MSLNFLPNLDPKGSVEKQQCGQIAQNRLGQIASHTAIAGSYPNIMLPAGFSITAFAPRETATAKRNAAISAILFPSRTGAYARFPKNLGPPDRFLFVFTKFKNIHEEQTGAIQNKPSDANWQQELPGFATSNLQK